MDSVSLLNLNAITDHPDFELLKSVLPTCFELLHPGAIFFQVREIDDDFRQVIPIYYAAVFPQAFNVLRLMAYGAELIADLKNSFCNPFAWHFASVIELARQHHLEAPPSRAHTWR